MTAALESLMYEGMREWNRYCPAVSQSCMRRLLLSTLTVFDTKSTPTVGWVNGVVLVRFLWSCRRWSDWWLMFCQRIGRPAGLSYTSRLDCFTFFKFIYSIGYQIIRDQRLLLGNKIFEYFGENWMFLRILKKLLIF